MDEAIRAKRTALWQRTFKKEIARRKLLLEQKPRVAKELFSSNPRGLVEDCGKPHVWIPASTVWIHDGKKRGHVINGIKRRGLQEAMAYNDRDRGVLVVPQVCNNCCAMRELESPIRSHEATQLEKKKQRRNLRRELSRKKKNLTTPILIAEDFNLA